MILSLQGCMAVGKTTAARYLEKHLPQVHVCFEDNAAVLAQIRERGLNKNQLAEYLEIQKLFLRQEIHRWQSVQEYPCTVMDFGAEEIEFYTLHYPQSKGLDWKPETIRQALAPELTAVQKCMPEAILFLDAADQTLCARKAGDTTRSREFFDFYRQHLLPLKRAWFRAKPGVTFLQTDGLTPEQVGEQARQWCLARMTEK